MRILILFFFALPLLGGLASCKTNVDPDSATSAILDSNKVDILTYAQSEKLNGTMTSSGLYFVMNKPGSSTVTPAYGQELEFTYKMSVLYGPSNTTVTSGVKSVLVDSVYADSSVYYPFFVHSLRAGLEEGFLMMHEGDQVTLLIPSALAFGSDDKTVPANSPVRYDITLKRVRTETQQISDYITANKLTVTETTSSGLRFIKTKSVDSGTSFPTANQTLTVKYSGRSLRARYPFDSTGVSTFSTSLGKSAIAGFNEGLAKLKKGEKATIIFPSTLGYGTQGAINSSGVYVVAPYSPLRFDLELTDVQ